MKLNRTLKKWDDFYVFHTCPENPEYSRWVKAQCLDVSNGVVTYIPYPNAVKRGNMVHYIGLEEYSIGLYSLFLLEKKDLGHPIQAVDLSDAKYDDIPSKSITVEDL